MKAERIRVEEFPTPTDRLVVAVLAQAVLMLVSLLVLFLFSLLTIENYFLLSFIGLLIVLHVGALGDQQPPWWTIARLIKIAGYIIFALIMYQRIEDIAVLI